MIGNLLSRQVVSVIIPCYNAEPFIEETIASVLAQTWPDVQIIVVDDGSTDSSWEKIGSFGDRIRAIRQPNRGGACARNVGFLASNGSSKSAKMSAGRRGFLYLEKTALRARAEKGRSPRRRYLLRSTAKQGCQGCDRRAWP